jgi:hypothetical protein
MKRAALAVALLATLAVCLATQAKADIGSCYSPKPVCIGTHPVCICDITQNCWWACK